jgi:hypothetical protein
MATGIIHSLSGFNPVCVLFFHLDSLGKFRNIYGFFKSLSVIGLVPVLPYFKQ